MRRYSTGILVGIVLAYGLCVLGVRVANAYGAPNAISHWFAAFGTKQQSYTLDYGNAGTDSQVNGGRTAGDDLKLCGNTSDSTCIDIQGGSTIDVTGTTNVTGAVTVSSTLHATGSIFTDGDIHMQQSDRLYMDSGTDSEYITWNGTDFLFSDSITTTDGDFTGSITIASIASAARYIASNYEVITSGQDFYGSDLRLTGGINASGSMLLNSYASATYLIATLTGTGNVIYGNKDASNNGELIRLDHNLVPKFYIDYNGNVYASGAVAMGTATFASATIANQLTVAGNSYYGGGYSDTGCTISSAGVLQCDGAMTTGSSITADSAAIGGGYGSTGCSVSSAGVLQCNGAATTDGLLTAASGTLSTRLTVAGNSYYGGGYGDTGATIESDGDILTDGDLTVDGITSIGTASAPQFFGTNQSVKIFNAVLDAGADYDNHAAYYGKGTSNGSVLKVDTSGTAQAIRLRGTGSGVPLIDVETANVAAINGLAYFHSNSSGAFNYPFANAGAVTIAQDGSGTGQTQLYVKAGNANYTPNLVVLENNGQGVGMSILNDLATNGVAALAVTHDGTGQGVDINNKNTSVGLNIDNTGTGNAIHVTSNTIPVFDVQDTGETFISNIGTGTTLDIDNVGGGSADLIDAQIGGGTVFRVCRSGNIAASGTACITNRSAFTGLTATSASATQFTSYVATGKSIILDLDAGTSNANDQAIDIDMAGTAGRGISITNTGGGQGISVESTKSNGGRSLYVQNTGTSNGDSAARIDHAGSGPVADFRHTGSGKVLQMYHTPKGAFAPSGVVAEFISGGVQVAGLTFDGNFFASGTTPTASKSMFTTINATSYQSDGTFTGLASGTINVTGNDDVYCEIVVHDGLITSTTCP